MQPGSVFCSLPTVYIADHDTTPKQVVTTDNSSMLIKALQWRKTESKTKKGKRQAETEAGEPSAAPPSRRGAAQTEDVAGPSAPPVNTAATTSGIPPVCQANYSRIGLQSRTIKELQGILKAWALPVSGKKDDLVNRILERQNE